MESHYFHLKVKLIKRRKEAKLTANVCMVIHMYYRIKMQCYNGANTHKPKVDMRVGNKRHILTSIQRDWEAQGVDEKIVKVWQAPH